MSIFPGKRSLNPEAENPDIFSKNKNIKRNDGANMGKGQN